MAAIAHAHLDGEYELKARGYDLGQVEARVREILRLKKEMIYSEGRRHLQVQARSPLCYWAVRELGQTCTDLAQRLGMMQPGVGYAVSRGEQIAKAKKYSLAPGK